jgi:hypothetical protein
MTFTTSMLFTIIGILVVSVAIVLYYDFNCDPIGCVSVAVYGLVILFGGFCGLLKTRRRLRNRAGT